MCTPVADKRRYLSREIFISSNSEGGCSTEGGGETRGIFTPSILSRYAPTSEERFVTVRLNFVPLLVQGTYKKHFTEAKRSDGAMAPSSLPPSRPSQPRYIKLHKTR